jgi:hypothetical protein
VKALTANDLLTGDTVFWSHGAWVEQFADAEIFQGEDADAALAVAEKQITEVVGCYLFDVQETPEGLAPVAYRERVRALGPTNHPQHGKQAEGAKRRQPRSPPGRGGAGPLHRPSEPDQAALMIMYAPFSAHPGEGRDPGQVTQVFAATSRGGAAAGDCCRTGSGLSWAPAFAGVSGVNLFQQHSN